MPRGKHGNHPRGPAHPRWNNGRMLSDEGYVKVRVGRDHPLADPNGYWHRRQRHAADWQSGQILEELK